MFTTIIYYIVSASGGYTLIFNISDIVQYNAPDRSIERIKITPLYIYIIHYINVYACARASGGVCA